MILPICVSTLSIGVAQAAPLQTAEIYDAPGGRVTLVIGDGPATSPDPQVLVFGDASGSTVRVYADHPVSFQQAQDDLARRRSANARADAVRRRLAAERR